MIAFAFTSGVLHLPLSSDHTDAQQRLALVVLSFLAGFSERWAQDTLAAVVAGRRAAEAEHAESQRRAAAPQRAQPAALALRLELARVGPVLLRQRPEVDRELIRDVLVRERAVAVVAPARAPRVPDDAARPSSRSPLFVFVIVMLSS